MRELRGMVAMAVLGFFSCTLALADDVVQDLSAVKRIEFYRGPESGKALLKKNGFVVTPSFHHRIFAPYFDKDLPHFATVDSVHNTFHVIFEDELKNVEAACVDEVLKITQEIEQALLADSQNRLTAKLLSDLDVKGLVEDYLLVADCLLSEKDAPADARPGVRDELALIQAAAGMSMSPLFKYSVDYSQFKPCGFYTETPVLRRYFKAMSWYGNMAFRVTSDKESLAAILIGKLVAAHDEIRQRWTKIDSLYSYLLAPCDDLTPVEYGEMDVGRGWFGGIQGILAEFKKQAASLREPKINSMALDAGEMGRWQELSKGMRLFGKRYIPDSEAFMKLTDPEVPGRGFPTGLDVMLANGSARAKELSARMPEGASREYQQGLEKAVEIFKNVKSAAQPTHYTEFLKLVETINAPALPEAPAFTKTNAYADKNLMTSLAAWASMRHAWALHAKASHITFGMDEKDPLRGYVEPNLAFFEAMHTLSLKTEQVFGMLRAASTERFKEFDELVLTLGEMVKKELARTQFSDKEIHLLLDYCYKISRLQGFNTNGGDRGFPWMALISDVHTEGQSRKCLEVGTGGAMPLYVIVEWAGVQYLMIGGVYSYYEFQQSMADPLTDEAWHAKWDAGQVPTMPSWTATFVAGQVDTATLIESIRKGAAVEDALFVNDPALNDFLERGVKPGGELQGKLNYSWALRLATAKLGRKMVPLLFDIIRTGDPTNQKESAGQNRPWWAANALGTVITVEDFSTLRDIMLASESEKLQFVGSCLMGMRDKALESFLVSLFKSTDRLDVKEECLNILDAKASKDITPFLIDCYAQTENFSIKLDAVYALAQIWAPKAPECLAETQYALPSEASEADLNKWQAMVKDLVLVALKQAFTSDDGYMEDPMLRMCIALYRLAGVLKIEEAIPILEAAVPKGAVESEAIEALGQIGTGAALEALLRLSMTEQARNVGFILETFEKIKPRGAVPRLRELLSDQRDAHSNQRRVCDLATYALAAIFPDGSGTTKGSAVQLSDRDAKIEEWKAFLDKNKP